jgi:hypothetical protein
MWLKLLLFHFFKTEDAAKTTGNCVQLLNTMLVAFEDLGRAEEIFSLPCTIDLVYLLVCRAEVYPGEPFAIYSVVSTLGMLSLCLDSSYIPGISTNFTLRLSTVNEGTRKAVISVLVGRAEQFSDHRILRHQLRSLDHRTDVSDGLLMLCAATSHFLNTNPSLWRAFGSERFVPKYANAFDQVAKAAASSGITDPRFWASLAKALILFTGLVTIYSPTRTYSLSTAIEAGLVSCALTCLVQLDSQSYSSDTLRLDDRVKELVQCYSHSSRVIKALAKTYPQETMAHIKIKRPELYGWIDGALHRGLSAFEVSGSSTYPHLCDNFQVG